MNAHDLTLDQKRQLLADYLRQKVQTRTFPLSFTQEQLWFLTEMEEALGDAYHIARAYVLSGPLEYAALQQALDALVTRHAVLRTRIISQEGQPLQQIVTTLSVPLEVVALPGADRREPDVASRLQQAASQPFDLAQAPLWRVTLLRLAEETHVLLLVFHHIIFDGWSLSLFCQELATLYSDFLAQRVPTLPPLPLQYVDFALWQRGTGQEQIASSLTYWRTQLADLPPVLPLPIDHPRPAVQQFQGNLYTFTLPAALAASLKALAQSEQTSLFMTLLAAFKVVLFRYTQVADIVVGTPVANRRQVELESLLGFFVNTLVLRSDLGGNPPFRTVLQRVRQVVLDAHEHQDVSFAQMVQELQPERNLSHNPLFQTMFSLRTQPPAALELPGLRVEPMELPRTTTQFDLNVALEETGDGLQGEISYSTALFEPATIARMVTHFTTLLEAVVRDPDQRIGTLPLLPAAERADVIERWNATATRFATGAYLHEQFLQQAERTPLAPALVFGTTSYPYQILAERVKEVAGYLRARGVGPETPVGICMERSVEMVVAIMATLHAGGAYVPMEPTYPPSRLRYIVTSSAMPLLLTQSHLVGDLPPLDAAVVALDQPLPASPTAPALDPAPLHDDNLAYVIYTSGSTGQPKGAMNTHGAIRNRILWMQQAYGLGASDRVLQKTPFTFDVSVWEFLWPLATGAALVIAEPEGHKDPEYLIDTITTQAITTLHFVPSMLQAFMEHDQVERCHSLERIICSGEALPADLAERVFARLPHVQLENLYGPTEAAIDVTYWHCTPAASRSIPIGRPIANTQIYILDPWLNPVPVGVPGELHIGGVNLARGYLQRPDLTAAKFIPDPFHPEPGARLYKSGDLARFRPDGAIEFLGRADNQIKLRGYRIELGEIEVALRLHPSVAEAIVVAHRVESSDTRLIAYVVAAPGPALDDELLREFLKASLPDYMVPAHFIVMPTLPLTSSGKVNRRALPAPDAALVRRTRPFVAPASAMESQIAAIWQELLQCPAVGRHDDFFELGGHSLLVARLKNRVDRAFQVTLPLRTYFNHPTVAELALAIVQWQAQQSDAAVLDDLLASLD